MTLLPASVRWRPGGCCAFSSLYFVAVKLVIFVLKHRGGVRNVSAAIDLVRTKVFSASNGDRARSLNIAIIFVHGVVVDHAATMRAASEARRYGITILIVGVTDNVLRSQLDSIASYPMLSNVFSVQNYYSFINVQSGLLRAVCNGSYIVILLLLAQ